MCGVVYEWEETEKQTITMNQNRVHSNTNDRLTTNKQTRPPNFNCIHSEHQNGCIIGEIKLLALYYPIIMQEEVICC